MLYGGTLFLWPLDFIRLNYVVQINLNVPSWQEVQKRKAEICVYIMYSVHWIGQ